MQTSQEIWYSAFAGVLESERLCYANVEGPNNVSTLLF